jgi:hypothetical protein
VAVGRHGQIRLPLSLDAFEGADDVIRTSDGIQQVDPWAPRVAAPR